MPNPCVVPYCKTNYRNGPKMKVYSFPTDPELSKKWIIAIRRKNFTPTKYSKVCSLHFQESDFKREASGYDPKTGRTLTAPLSNIRLKKDAVPSLFKFSDHSKSVNEDDQEGIILRHRQFSPRLQQNIPSTKLKNSHLTDTLKSKISLENENTNNLKKRPGRKKKKQQAKGTATDEVEDFSVRCHLNSNQETSSSSSSSLNEKIYCVSKSSQCLPAVCVKVEKPWEEEYNYAGKSSVDKSEDCDKLEIEIKDVRSVSNGISTKADKNRAEISESSSIFTRPLKITKREEIFGNLVACELSDLCKNPELYLKTKQSILDVLVQAHFEQIKCCNPIL